jgi:hypothetical protein
MTALPESGTVVPKYVVIIWSCIACVLYAHLVALV